MGPISVATPKYPFCSHHIQLFVTNSFPGREKQRRTLSILSLLVLLGLEVLVGAKGSQTADEDDSVGDRAEAGRVRVGRGGQRGLGGRGARVAGLQGESVSQVS